MAKINKAVTIELFTSVILDTPVLEGRLRANWLVSSGSPANGTVENIDQGATTADNTTNFVLGLDGSKDFKVYLTNNLPYADFIENGGSTQKAPEGMVRKNFIRVVDELKNA